MQNPEHVVEKILYQPKFSHQGKPATFGDLYINSHRAWVALQKHPDYSLGGRTEITEIKTELPLNLYTKLLIDGYLVQGSLANF